jgi:hypothetical protein
MCSSATFGATRATGLDNCTVDEYLHYKNSLHLQQAFAANSKPMQICGGQYAHKLKGACNIFIFSRICGGYFTFVEEIVNLQ